LDPSAGIWLNVNGTLVKQQVLVEFASLASQATGPPLDDTEMSYSGRTFPQLGRKMLSLTPLGKQLVHPGDSVLGTLSNSVPLPDGRPGPQKGLKVSYQQLIQDAFQDRLWNQSQLTPEGFTQMEANFSFFWGLAIQLYEATLVSDQTPFDRFLGGDQAALTTQQQDGFSLFFGAAGCAACHINSELSSASVRSSAFLTNASHALIEPMTVASGLQVIYDNGFNNTGVRPIAEDIARGGSAPFLNAATGQPFPLSFSALAELQALNTLVFNPNLFPLGAPVTPILPAQIRATFPVANQGNFKVPMLRNVELTAPYFHDGGALSLEDVVLFYVRGGNFPAANEASLDPAIVELGTLQNQPAKQAALVAFLKSLTDERVRNESAPFDHPELFVPVGDPGFLSIPARDAGGNPAVSLLITLNPVASPTGQASQVIGGSVDAGSTVTVQVDTGASVGPVAVNGTTWSAQLSGLLRGVNTVTVTATNQAGESASVKGSITLLTTPVLTLNPVQTPTASATQTIGGTVETGLKPVVLVNSAATVGPVTTANGGTTWSCTLSGLALGSNIVTVVVLDAADNLALRSAQIGYAPGDGDLNLDGRVDLADALAALKASVGSQQLSAEQKLHADVAPLVNGVSVPDGQVNVADALVILKKVVGALNF